MGPQPPRNGEGGLPRLRAGRVLLAIALAIALVAGVVGVIGNIADFDRLREALGRIDPVWLAPAVTGKLAGYAGYILAYRDVAAMRDGPRLPAWAVTRIVGIGFGAFVAGSAAGGLAVDWWALRRAGCGGHDALRRVLGFNTLQWAALGTFAALAGLAVVAGDAPEVPAAMALAWLVGVPLCFAGGLWASAPGRNDRLSRIPLVPPLRPVTPRAVARWAWAGLRVGLADAIGGLRYVRPALWHPIRHRAGVLGYALYWVGDMFTLYACVRAFGADIGLEALVLAYATGYVATALPLPVGGAGGVDAAMTLALTAVGLPLAEALLVSVTYRGVSFWLPIAPALALLPTAPRLSRDLAEIAAGAGAGSRG
jgi:glycosyltransferase 2 family protein